MEMLCIIPDGSIYFSSRILNDNTSQNHDRCLKVWNVFFVYDLVFWHIDLRISIQIFFLNHGIV